MKKIKTIGISLLIAACAVCLSLAFVACGNDEEPESVDMYGYGEEGFYYYDGADSARYMLSLQSGNYMITANGDVAYSGEYTCDGETGEITFSSAAQSFAATLGESSLSLDMGDSGYSFKAYKYFDVTYVDENGNTVATESVLNGQSAESITVEKDGYYFIGWYEDLNSTTEFAFDTSIAGDMTVYGWYIEKNPEAADFVVTLDYGDGHTETVSTMNGAVWTLPSDYEGKDILGWWASATNKSGELTYKYNTGDAFTSDTNLYAVYDGMGASVTSAGITWENAAASNVYVSIYGGDGNAVLDRASTSSSNTLYAPSEFTSLATGTYTIEVESGSATEYLTYVVNGLARVSVSSAGVIAGGNGKVFSFAPVDGATGYIVTVSDGTRTITEDIGNYTYYNFSDWDMTKDGITFTVTAYADGFESSVSDAFAYVLVLGGIVVDITDDVVSWNRVESAMEYEVIVSGTTANGTAVSDSFTTTSTSFSLVYYETGTYTVTVQPKTAGYYSEADGYYGYAKSTLAAPRVTDVTDYSVSWNEVEGATSYVVLINGTEYAVTDGTTLVFSDTNVPTGAGSYEIAVMALGDGYDSPYGGAIVATEKKFASAVEYDTNTVYWNYDVAAASYRISVNGVTACEVADGNSQKISLTKAGDNQITVTALDANGVSLGQSQITVYAYSVILDPNGATIDGDGAVYVAPGDVLSLGEAVKVHAKFVGWYTQADYTQGQSDEYTGVGTLVADGEVFTGNRDLYLYAYWTYEYVTVTLDIGSGSFANGWTATSVQIKYGSTSFELPMVTPATATSGFMGWYTTDSGTGTRYADGTGTWNPVVPFEGETTLYAYCVEDVLAYSRTVYNGETVYSVSAGTYIGNVGEITVAETYEGCGVILNSGAFQDCSGLKVVNVPDTIKYIVSVYNGYDAGTGAFAGCSALEAVNVYVTGDDTDSTKEIEYYSVDGVLFRKTSDTEAELYYYPHGKTDATYAVPSEVSNWTEVDAFDNPLTYKVTTLPGRVFKGKVFSEIIIPSSVTKIETYAFYNNANLKQVTFEYGESGGLGIDSKAFYNCTALTDVMLPSRYEVFDAGIFSGCTVLQNVHISNDTYESESGVIFSADGNTLVYFPVGRSGDVNIQSLTKNVVIYIGDSAFAQNTNMTGVVIPGSVVSIGAYAFDGCTRITSVTIPASVTTIGKYAFNGCTGMRELTFEGNAQSGDLTISDRAFYGCSSLMSVKLPVNLTTLGSNAFGNCTRLSYVYYDVREGTELSALSLASGAFGTTSYVTTLILGANIPEIDFAAIFGTDRLERVEIDPDNKSYLSDDCGAVYSKDGTTIMFYPSARKGEYTLLGTAETIGSGAFSNKVNLTKITIGESVTSIADKAFSGCTFLEAIEVNSTNTVYGSQDGILYKKSGDDLTELVYCPIRNSQANITAPGSVVKIDAYAFENNVAVTSISFASSTAFTVADHAFYNATGLTTVALPDCVTEIPTYAFAGCTELLGDLSTGGTMTLPGSLETIGTYAFDGDKKFAATIPASVSSIGNYAFRYCWDDEVSKSEIKFASVGDETAPDLTMGTYVFYYCEYATKLEIPHNIVEIGNYGFQRFGYEVTDCVDEPITFETGCQLSVFSNSLFYYAINVKTITLPDSLTYLSSYSLSQMTSLTSLVIPDSVYYISGSTFAYDRALESITLPTNANFTSMYAAYNSCSSLKEITIPASVTSIAKNTFELCESLEKVTFAEGSPITTINEYTFYECYALTEVVNLPSGLTTIDTRAFDSCYGLTSITIPASVTSIGNYAFTLCTSLAEVKFEEGSNLQSIGYYAFSGCSALTSFSFPETTSGSISLSQNLFGVAGVSVLVGPSITDIETTYYYTPVTSLTLSSSVTDLGNALADCTTIETIIVAEGNTHYSSDEENKILYDYNKSTIAYIFGTLETTEYTVPDGISAIGAYAFQQQTSLTTVTIPATVTSVGDYAFNGCEALTSVTFSGGATGCLMGGSVGMRLFEGCTALTTVTLPTGITAIPDYMFYELAGLTTVNNVSAVQTIGQYAFYGSGITSISLPNVTSLGNQAFRGCADLVTITFGDTCPSLGTYMFYGCESLVIETLPNGITSFPNYTFYGCKSIERFVIPSTVTAITGTYLFADCESLTEVVIPSNITSLPNYTFRGCSSLTVCDIPAGCTSFGTYCFQGTGLESIIIPDGCTSLSNYMFQYSESLTTVIIPDSVTSIGTYVFRECTALTTVIMSSNVTSIGNYAFNGCTALTEIQFGPYLSSLGTYVFQNCTSLEKVEFGSNLASIGNYSLSGCTSLKEVTFERGVETIGTYVFQNCTSLEYVVIQSTVTSVGTNAFEGCDCDVYVNNTYNHVATYWNSGWLEGFEGEVYYYSDIEPEFNGDGTGYDDNYWFYDENDDIAVWEFDYTTYTVGNGGYVLCAEDGGIAYVCLYDEDADTSTVYAVSECTSGAQDGTYSVALENGDVYTVVLDETASTATVTAVENSDADVGN